MNRIMKSDTKAGIIIFLIIASISFMAKDHIAIAGKTTEGYSNSEPTEQLEKLKPKPLDTIRRESKATAEEVCMAKILFSESKSKVDWVYIGWTARNRVTLKYRGKTYCEVAHSPSQFSAISLKSDPIHTKINSIHKAYLKNKLSGIDKPIWEDAIKVGRSIINADNALNPVPDATHFWYIPAYENGNIDWPYWARGKSATYILRKPNSKEITWAFYKQSDIV